MPDKEGPIEAAFLPYGKQEIGDADIKAVVEALCSGWLTTGPRVAAFETAFAAHCGAGEGVAVNSGTAALHCAMRALGIGPGDEVIMPSYTFVSTANAFALRGGVPVFIDIRPDTLNLDEGKIEQAITARTKAIVPTRRLDDYLSLLRGRRLLVKIDVEGAEHLVFEGATEVLAGQRPSVLCESFEISKLQGLGRQRYRIFSLAEDGNHLGVPAEAELPREIGPLEDITDRVLAAGK